MTQLFANNATTTLASGITAAATSMAVAAGAGAKFPSPTAGDYFMLTLFQMAAGVESNYEVVKVTGRSVDTLTIVRAQESTTARAFITGDQVSLRATASALNNFAQLASGGTFGAPVFAPTAAAGTNTTQVATTAFATTAVANAVAALIGTAPGVLDTLGELGDALADDAAFSTTVTTALSNRLRTDTAAQGLTGTQKLNAVTNLGLAAVASSGLKADVGLGNVDNTSDVAKPVSTAQQTALNLKANLISPAFAGDPTAPTAASGDNDTSLATTAFVQLAANGFLSKSVAGAVDVTLTVAEAGYATIKLTGALTANINVIVPAVASRWTIWNATTGAFTLTVKTAAGTGDIVTQGSTWQLLCDGTNVLDANSDFRDVALSGNPTAPTAAANTNTTQIATTAFVGTAVANLVNSSPSALDTLNELATALGNDPSFATTMTNALAAKAPLASPALTGNPTAPTAASGDSDTSIATTAFVQQAANGQLTKNASGGTFALTAAEAGYATIQLTGTVLANMSVIVPTAASQWTFINATTGGFNITIRTSAGTGIVVTQGTSLLLLCDGVNVIKASSDFKDLPLTGVPTAPTAAANTNTTQLATTAFVAAATATKAPLAGSSTQSFAANDMAVNSLNGGPLAGFRNVLINGDMRIAQRTLPVTGGYCLDRWSLNNGGNPISASQSGPAQNFSGEPGSFILYLTGAAGNTDHNITQRVEAINSRHMAGKTVTLSFWHFNNTGASQLVKCTIDFATAGQDNFSTTTNVGVSAGTTCPAGQWTFVSASFTLPAAATNGVQIYLGWAYGAVVAGQSVGYGNVQLELGTVATPFERRPYGVELTMCQRYYESLTWPSVFASCGAGSLNSYYMPVFFKTTKRSVPTITLPSSTNAAWDTSGANITPTTWSVRDASTGGVTVVADSSVKVAGVPANACSINAEL